MKIKYMVLIIIAFLSATSAHAAISSLTVTVEGMACPFCAFGVEKRINKVKGVNSVNVDMRTGQALVTAEPDASIHYRDIPQAIRDAGFTPGEMRITSSGHVGKDKSNRMIFSLEEFPLTLIIDNNELQSRLETAIKSGRPMMLTGPVFFNKDKKWIFNPETVEKPES